MRSKDEILSELIQKIEQLKQELDVCIVAHYYQKDEVFNLADYTGDSLQLAQLASQDKRDNLIFCGVGFMGQSVKILAPHKRVLMPRVACCSMARMIDELSFDTGVKALNEAGIKTEIGRASCRERVCQYV